MFFTPCKLAVISGLGLFLALAGGILSIFWPRICDEILDKELILKDGSLSYKMWKVTPVPLYLRVFMFNCTNSEDVAKNKAKPKLVQVGPYTFKGGREKVDLDWTPNSTIKYRQVMTWYFDETLSNGSQSDRIVSLDVPALVATNFVKGNIGEQWLLDIFFGKEKTKAFTSKTVAELLFQGYNDPILHYAKKFGFKVPYDKFGWFYPRNGSSTYDGYFEMNTGAADIMHLARMEQWDNVTQTQYYQSYCGMVNGSEGELFPPKRERTNITIFFPDICRTISMPYLSDTSFLGVNSYRYALDRMLLANRTTCPSNWCFSPQTGQRDWPDGVLDVAKCKFGAPAFVSLPHFLYADPYYTEQVEGMRPDEKEHRMFLDLQADSGIPVKLSARFQVNLLLEPMKHIWIYSNVPKVIFPVFWFQMDAELNDELAGMLRTFANVDKTVPIALYVIIGLGAAMLVVGCVIYLPLRRKQLSETIDDQEGLLDKE